VAEWLRSGLQSRLHRFDSGRRLYWVFEGFWRGVPCETTRESRVIILGVCVGARNQELRGLRGEHFQRDDFVWISPDIAKGQRERWVPVLDEARSVVEDIRDSVGLNHYVVPARRPSNPPYNTRWREYPEKPSSPQAIWRMLEFDGPAEPPDVRGRIERALSAHPQTPHWSPADGLPGHDEVRLWLDDDLDDRAAPQGWVHVTTAQEAIALLDTGRVVELSLDHDLGDDQRFGRGIDVVDRLAEQQEAHGRILWPRDGITIHSANPAGRDAMVRAIENYAGRTVEVRRSFTPSGKPRLTFSLGNG
jgi:hypothetical protein